MDRKAWIILVLCGIALVANTFLGSKTQKEVEQSDQAPEQEQITDQSKPALVVQNSEHVAKVQKDELHVIEGKDGDKVDVIYTFTNFGGGVKSAAFPQHQDLHEEGYVKLNTYSAYPVGALANNYNEIDTTHYAVVNKGANFIIYRGVVGDDLEVTKTWRLDTSKEALGYRLTLSVQFKNLGKSSINLSKYGVYTGTAAPLHAKEMPDKAGWFYYEDGSFDFDAEGPFKGGWFSDPMAVKYLKPSSLEYAGVNNQFFTTFFMPKGYQADSLWATGRERDVREGSEMLKRWVFTMGVNFPQLDLLPESTQSYNIDVYMGPRERPIIKEVGPHTDAIMNYGWFSWFANIMSWSLNEIHNWFPNRSWSWGVSIILLTIFIRIIIWPLHNKSTRTMKRMSKLQPIMKELREKHADNPQKLNQETMKLYRQYGVNPMGGCLPMLIQIPIFFGVFKVLGAAVEMRGSSFLWVKDLSRPDTLFDIPVPLLGDVPFNALPIIMALTMVLQMRLTPQSGDKLQRRIFMLMPLIFFFFCYNYASALALYWSTQNIVSIGQTLLMKRLPEPELKEKGKGSDDDSKPRKKGFFEKMAEKMEEVQRQQEIAAGKKPGGPKKPANPFDQMKEAKKPKKKSPKTGG